MYITKTSILTGVEHTLDIPVTLEQLHAWQQGALIQNVMSHLSKDEREFLISGITESEWETYMKEEE
jgi:hypothetical protein